LRSRICRALGTPVAGLLCCAFWLACGDGVIDDPILRLSSEEAFAKGQELMAAEKFDSAREHFAHAFQTAPNSEIGREALLLQADAYYLAGGESNFIRAEGKYRDFNNRYPTSDKGAYVQFQIASSLEKRERKPDRDTTETTKAIVAHEELLALYPTSEYAAEALAAVERLNVTLAEHEYLVAKYQFRRGLHKAAIDRIEYLMEHFPEYPEMDKALCILGRARHQLKESEEAEKIYARLRSEYPESQRCKQAMSAKR